MMKLNFGVRYSLFDIYLSDLCGPDSYRDSDFGLKTKKCVPYLTPERTVNITLNDIESTKSQISCYIPKLFMIVY